MAIDLQQSRPSLTRAEVRWAAWGATLVAAGYILLPSFRAIVGLFLAQTESTFPRAADIPVNEWWGVAGAVIFGVIGVGMLMLVTAVGVSDTPSERWAMALGVLGAGGYLLVGGHVRGMYSFASAKLVEISPDAGTQDAALWAINIAGNGPVVVAGCASAGWFWWIAWSGRRRGLFGRAVVVTATVAAIAILVAEVGFDFLPVQFLFVPLAGVFAVSFWRQGRALRDTVADG